jgi:signal peptidase I
MSELQLGSIIAPRQEKPRGVKFFIVVLLCMGLALACLAGFFTARFLWWAQCSQFRAFRSGSGSMCPAVCENEHFLVGVDAFAGRPPRRGDVIMFQFDKAEGNPLYVKRVVGIGGDTVARGPSNTILINGQPLVLAPTCGAGNVYKHLAPEGLAFEPVKVPDDSVFVIGDSLDNSYDSRSFGVVGLDRVRGRALLIYASPNPSRLFCRVQ